MIRRITIAALAAFLMGALLAVPASSADGPQAVASKKAKKCKKKAKRKKGCKKGTGGGASSLGLPGQATPSKPTQPPPPDTPPTLHVTSLAVDAGTVLGGNSTTGHVVIDAAAPSGGQVVNLASTSSRASVPSSVIVAPDQNSASFQVTTASGNPGNATLTASIGSSEASTVVKVVDSVSVSFVQMQRHCLTVGPLSSNLVRLDVPAPVNTLVNLSSSDVALTVPDSVMVPAGQTSAFFSATAVSSATSVIVIATLNASQATDTVSVSDTTPEPTSADMTLQPASVNAGRPSVGTVTLDCEATGDIVFVLAADPASVTNSSNVTLPPSVTVHAGERSATFTIGTGAAALDDYAISATSADFTANATLTVTGQPD